MLKSTKYLNITNKNILNVYEKKFKFAQTLTKKEDVTFFYKWLFIIFNSLPIPSDIGR